MLHIDQVSLAQALISFAFELTLGFPFIPSFGGERLRPSEVEAE